MPRESTVKEQQQTPPSFEDGLRQLEEIVEKMAGGELPLEELVVNHERAMLLLGQCQERLTAARERIQLVESRGAEVVLTDFETGKSAGGVG